MAIILFIVLVITESAFLIAEIAKEAESGNGTGIGCL